LGKSAEQVLPRSEGEGGKAGGGQRAGGEMAQTIYTHMNKCINNEKEETIVQYKQMRSMPDMNDR
jgi:hypothetical protein